MQCILAISRYQSLGVSQKNKGHESITDGVRSLCVRRRCFCPDSPIFHDGTQQCTCVQSTVQSGTSCHAGMVNSSSRVITTSVATHLHRHPGRPCASSTTRRAQLRLAFTTAACPYCKLVIVQALSRLVISCDMVARKLIEMKRCIIVTTDTSRRCNVLYRQWVELRSSAVHSDPRSSLIFAAALRERMLAMYMQRRCLHCKA